MTINREMDYVSIQRNNVRQLWEALNNLVSAQREYNAMDYGTTLGPEAFTGENTGLTSADIGAVVFDTANALITVLNAGHATNLAKLL